MWNVAMDGNLIVDGGIVGFQKEKWKFNTGEIIPAQNKPHPIERKTGGKKRKWNG